MYVEELDERLYLCIQMYPANIPVFLHRYKVSYTALYINIVACTF